MVNPPTHIPDDLRRVADIFAVASRECWLVGGAVRDGLMGRKSEDYDLATDAEPEEVIRLFHRTIPTGIKHGTITIILGSHQFETTTFRRDGDYTDGRRPDSVTYSSNITEDLARRDFTINAIAWDLINRRLLDPHHGQRDLNLRIIKAIGVPGERFREDGLRSIRACRFASQLQFSVHEETIRAISENLSHIPTLSVERIWEELKKILVSQKPSTAFDLFMETGLMDLLIPELKKCSEIHLHGNHTTDVLGHSLNTCDCAESGNLHLRTAALFHDIGKPLAMRHGNNGAIIFHHHEVFGAEITGNILGRYKASNIDRKRITDLVRQQNFHYVSSWTDAEVRKFMVRVGLNLLDDLIALRLADDAESFCVLHRNPALLEELRMRIHKILESKPVLSLSGLCINGQDLINKLGVKPGPVLGSILNYLLDCVLENPRNNRYHFLLASGKKWLENNGHFASRDS